MIDFGATDGADQSSILLSNLNAFATNASQVTMKAQTALKQSSNFVVVDQNPMNSLIMSQDRMPSNTNQPQMIAGSSSGAIKKRKQTTQASTAEFRKTSNGPLSRKTAYQLNNAFLGNSVNRAKSSMNNKK